MNFQTLNIFYTPVRIDLDSGSIIGFEESIGFLIFLFYFISKKLLVGNDNLKISLTFVRCKVMSILIRDFYTVTFEHPN